MELVKNCTFAHRGCSIFSRFNKHALIRLIRACILYSLASPGSFSSFLKPSTIFYNTGRCKGVSNWKSIWLKPLVNKCFSSIDFIWIVSVLNEQMDLGKLFISMVLVVLFYLLFGHESISKLKKRGMTISHTESQPKNIKSPGNVPVFKITLR